MGRAFGALLLMALLLAGCGDSSDADGRADDPAPTSSGPTSSGPTSSGPSEAGEPAEDGRLVEIVHATAVDGRVSTMPAPIGDAEAIADFSAQFTRPVLQAELLRVVRSNPPAPGRQLVGAVVAVGCDVPDDVAYVDGEVHAMKVKDPLRECFAPVTSVAVLEVPA
jgi:hypothetical protein